MDKRYAVKGCGVTLICETLESVNGWVVYIIQKGGVPEVREITGEVNS